LTVREYFKDGNTTEKALAAKADELWKGGMGLVYTKEKTRYTGIGLHYGWEMNC
jgi:hypothetical protein